MCSKVNELVESDCVSLSTAPGSFTPIIANFTAASDSPTSEPGPRDGEFKTFPEFESVAK